MNKKTLKETKLDQAIVGYLYDQATQQNVKAKVRFINGMICINIEGYGDLTSNEGEGEPILIESFDNKVRVLLWGDINEEETTHIIDMSGAKEFNRNEN